MSINCNFLIYKCTNTLNGKSYIGTTSQSLNRRLYRHRWDANRGSMAPFHAALRKYKWNIWHTDIIYMSYDELDIAEKEELFIVEYDTFDNGYNGNKTGKSSSNSLPLIGDRNHMYRIGNKHPLYNKSRSDVTKQRIKENHRDVSGASNSRAKRFILTDPQGSEYIVDGNLQQFCDKYMLCRASIVKVSQGKQSNHKGWTVMDCGRVKYISEDEK